MLQNIGILAGWVGIINRIIVAIGKHIVAEETLPGRCEGIGINESADLGVVITALKIVEPGLSIVPLATRPNTPGEQLRVLPKLYGIILHTARENWTPQLCEVQSFNYSSIGY